MDSSHPAKYLGSSPNRPNQRWTLKTRFWRACLKGATPMRVCTRALTITPRTLTRWVPQKRNKQSKFNTNTRWVAGRPRSTTSFWRPYVSTARTGTKSRSMSRRAAFKIYVRTLRNSIRNLKNWLMRKEICSLELIGTSRRWLAWTSTAVHLTILSCSWKGRKKMPWKRCKIREHLRMNK